MLVMINGQTMSVKVPAFFKHKDYNWFLMLTENEAVEVMPWGIKIEDKNLFPSAYQNRIEDALGDFYEESSRLDFYTAYVALTTSIVNTIAPPKTNHK